MCSTDLLYFLTRVGSLRASINFHSCLHHRAHRDADFDSYSISGERDGLTNTLNGAAGPGRLLHGRRHPLVGFGGQ